MNLGLALDLPSRVMAGGWQPWPGAAAHLDFVNRRYFGNGAALTEAAFASFSGASFGAGAAAGLVGNGTAASHDISMALATLGIVAPFTMATVLRPTNVNSTLQIVARLHASDTPDSNHSSHQIASNNALQHQTIVGGVNQALQAPVTVSNDTVYAVTSMIQTDKFFTAVNGTPMGVGDFVGTIPAHATLRLLENAAGSGPFTGSIRHILFFQHVGGAEPNNAANAALSAALANL